MSAKPQKRFAEDKEILPRIDMYRLSVDIDTDDHDILMQLQQELSTGLSRLAQTTGKRIGYSFAPIEDLGETERRNRSIRDTMAGVDTRPPPEERLTSLPDRITLDDVKEELRKYIMDWEEYKDKRNEDFINKEEMDID